jgi:DNA-binding CsgD family transcriptional regulator
MYEDVTSETPQPSIPVQLLSVLEALRCGGVLLNHEGRVLSFNTTARGCLGDSLALAGEHLNALDRDSDRRLQRVVLATLNRHKADVPMSVAVSRAARLPLVIHPIRLNEHAPHSVRSAWLLLLIFDPEVWSEIPHEVLSQAFGLTRTESEVAKGVVSGKALSKIAALRGVKVGTVRAHLKKVFSKTHTHGQADLTRVLTRLGVFMPQAERTTATTSHSVRKSIQSGGRRRLARW